MHGRRNGALTAIRRAMDRRFTSIERDIRNLQKSVRGLRKTTNDLFRYVVLLDEEAQIQKKKLREHLEDTVRHLR